MPLLHHVIGSRFPSRAKLFAFCLLLLKCVEIEVGSKLYLIYLFLLVQ